MPYWVLRLVMEQQWRIALLFVRTFNSFWYKLSDCSSKVLCSASVTTEWIQRSLVILGLFSTKSCIHIKFKYERESIYRLIYRAEEMWVWGACIKLTSVHKGQVVPRDRHAADNQEQLASCSSGAREPYFRSCRFLRTEMRSFFV
jgi:hypothetical protein